MSTRRLNIICMEKRCSHVVIGYGKRSYFATQWGNYKSGREVQAIMQMIEQCNAKAYSPFGGNKEMGAGYAHVTQRQHQGGCEAKWVKRMLYTCGQVTCDSSFLKAILPPSPRTAAKGATKQQTYKPNPGSCDQGTGFWMMGAIVLQWAPVMNRCHDHLFVSFIRQIRHAICRQLHPLSSDC